MKFRLDTPLVQPEYEREEYASEITPDDKALLARGKTLQHLVTVHNSITGEAERCHVAFNPSTNRLVAVPHRDVKIPEFAEGRRIDDAGQKSFAAAARSRWKDARPTAIRRTPTRAF